MEASTKKCGGLLLSINCSKTVRLVLGKTGIKGSKKLKNNRNFYEKEVYLNGHAGESEGTALS